MASSHNFIRLVWSFNRRCVFGVPPNVVCPRLLTEEDDDDDNDDDENNYEYLLSRAAPTPCSISVLFLLLDYVVGMTRIIAIYRLLHPQEEARRRLVPSTPSPAASSSCGNRTATAPSAR